MLQRTLLRDSDIEPLAQGVVATLETVGILCQNDELLNALAAAGATVDFASQRVHFPKKMQAEFVAQFRSEVGRAYLHAERPARSRMARYSKSLMASRSALSRRLGTMPS